MKLFKWLALVFCISLLFAMTLSILKSDKMIVEASYMMLACEDCNHMMVEKSSSKKYVGKTIIPLSSKVNIDEVIGEIALTRESVCFIGKAHLYNVNVFGINPDGIRFRVVNRLPILKCDEAINHLTKSSNGR